MEPLDFLAAVLPSAGKYCTFALNPERNIFSKTHQELYETTKAISDAGGEVWFGLGAFAKVGNRKASNVTHMRSFFMDLDCGLDVKTGEQRAFKTKRDAVEALDKFLIDSGLGALGSPWLIDSGGGVHPYWPLKEDLSKAEWKPVAEALKIAAFEHKFNIDTTVTADAARVLRLPGTDNNKSSTRRPVRVVHRGDIFDFAAIRDVLSGYVKKVKLPKSALAIAGDPLGGQKSALAELGVGSSVNRFRTIMMKTEQGTGCGQLANYINKASDDGMEPIWRGVLSWTKYCVDGEKASKMMSALHPYDEERRLEKMHAIVGPYSCVSMNTIQQGICTECPNWERITNPLALGRELPISKDKVEITPPQPDAPRYYRPELPPEYDYHEEGGIIYHKPADPTKKHDTQKDIRLTSYDVFRTRTFFEKYPRVEYRTEFTAIKEDKHISFVIPNSIVGNQGKVIEVLSAHNIFTTHGAATDAYLVAYIRKCITIASENEEVVRIPPHFGWQDDGSFAVGDMVYSPLGSDYDYAFSSSNLHNLIQATETAGDLAGWRAAWEVFIKRNSWGHIAIGLQGFSSILMHFMPKNSRACTLHICGKQSGAGKTLALTMACNVWGDQERYKVTPTTSTTTMMQRAGLLGSLPLPVDESTTLQRKTNGEFVPTAAFDYSQGAHKIKGSAMGNTEISHELLWSGKMLLTSNDPAFEAMLGARQYSSHGEVRRMLEWELTGNSELEWTDEEREMIAQVSEHYGVAGRTFAIWCVRNREKTEEVCKQMYEYWRKYSGAKDNERYWTSSIGCDLAATVLLNSNHSGIIQIPVSGIRDHWLGVVKAQRKMIVDTTTTALDLLHRYIADNNAAFVKVKSGNIDTKLIDFGKLTPDTPRTSLRGRVEADPALDSVKLFVEEKLLRVHCAQAGMGYTSFIKELGTQATVLVNIRKDLLAGTNGPSMRVKCVQVNQSMKEVDDLV